MKLSEQDQQLIRRGLADGSFDPLYLNCGQCGQNMRDHGKECLKKEVNK